MNRHTFLLVPLLAVGCVGARPTTTTSRTGAAANQAPVVKPAPGTRVICEDETPTGSHIPVRTCYRVLDDLERNHARDAAIDALNKPQTQMRSGH
ncbi:MAG TPA: hypothetical protein VEM76_21845 [Anaeromyxobacteraceae bacterium]|nr:hypothetical protein [Anaeromyxobacteraceae bacterium]